MMNYFRSIFGIVFVLVMLAGFTAVSFSEYVPPRIQLESGVLPENIQCRENRVLVIRTNGSPACVTEKSAERMGWKIIAKNQTSTVTEKDQKDNSIEILDNSSNVEIYSVEYYPPIPITSGVEYSGDIFGHAGKLPVRSPPDHVFFSWMNPENLVLFQGVNEDNVDSYFANLDSTLPNIIAQTDDDYFVSDNYIDYIKWMPRHIPDGYELEYVYVTYPSERHDIGRIQINYVPVGYDIPLNATAYQLRGVANFEVNVTVGYWPMISQERMDKLSQNPNITYTEEYGGIVERVYVSPSDENLHVIKLYTEDYRIQIGGTGYPFEESEKVLQVILELQ